MELWPFAFAAGIVRGSREVLLLISSLLGFDVDSFRETFNENQNEGLHKINMLVL
jgi:hypothetical protein